jgi:hypothetical protein
MSTRVPIGDQRCIKGGNGAAYAIQPDGNLISSVFVLARKEPEVQFARLVV